MNAKDEAASIKYKNVIEMAVIFTAMIRVFEKGSKQKIAKKLESSFERLARVEGKDDFEEIHTEFCEWFLNNVSTAKRVLKNKQIKESQAASYGQAAKVFNIALKIYVYYCNLPDRETAAKLLPLLHAAVDTPMMMELEKDFPDANLKAKTIAAVGKTDYVTLRKLVMRHIDKKFGNQILPVEYEDIMWYRLNRGALE
jgi:hypothetical protein